MKLICFTIVILVLVSVSFSQSLRLKRQWRQQNNFGGSNPGLGQNNRQQQQTNQQTNTNQAPQQTNPTAAFKDCMGGCQALPFYSPICGTDGQTYHNEQRLACAQRCGADVRQASIGTCVTLGTNWALS